MVFLLLIFGCKKEDSLRGEWKLMAQLMDPGDGSGVFVPVLSERKIEFLKNGKLKSNGELCYPGINSTESSEGTYSLEDSTISITTCAGSTELTLTFTTFADTLILWYPCFEPCAEKYVRVD